jgi:hypothetical protein
MSQRKATPAPCPHDFSDPTWCDLCQQGIGTPRRLVVSLLLDDDSDELYSRVAALVCTTGVTAWQVDTPMEPASTG